MFWLIAIGVVIGIVVFMMALCKAAGEADDRMEEMFERRKGEQ